HDLPHRAPAMGQQRSHAILQARTEQRVRQVGPSLGQPAYAVTLGHFTAAKSAQLREHVPDPVTALCPCTQLFKGLLIIALLRLDEASQIERIDHGPDRSCPMGVVSGSVPCVAKSGLCTSESSGMCAYRAFSAPSPSGSASRARLNS